ncbi:MAG: efflux RND transporter periplasmic adaptor subunit [Deltaproteobacteria bacterium]|nr:efflux RND transporter periplasmic adaptor subunit [Deltaproteobacteria bacterium]MBL7082146.1 efflux RND transporter periplasmic adaptor subunit [Candidatus Aminicenantes bacterium]
MRKLSIFLLGALLAFTISCGKSGDNGQNRTENPSEKGNPGKAQTDKGAQAKSGQKPGSKSSENIDIDKLDIPDQVKEAIKSGRIPKDQIPEILARFQSGGEAVPVSSAPVQRKNLNSYLVLNGIVEPERKIEIFSRLSAYVQKIVKEEGAYVKENDILALLDDTEIKISYEQAKIQLEQAKLSLEEAEKNFIRNQELIKRDLISEQDFQTQEALYKQRQLDYQDRMESFKNLQLQLNWTKIRALSEGYITERLIEMGDRVNTNEQVYTIEDFKPLLIRVSVPTSDSIKLKIGMPAEVKTEVLKGNVFTGDVKLINPRVDVQTGTVKVTVEVLDESLTLKPGMFVEVRIAIGMKENVLVIPRRAILYKQNKTYVFVMNRNQVSQREVFLGLLEEDHVEVTNGLNEGEVIVVVGVEGLKDGQRVDVIQ